MSFSILDNVLGKESYQPGRPIMLVTITAKDGTVAYFTSAAGLGADYLFWNNNIYQSRIIDANIDAVQAVSQQGYDVVPSFTLKLGDADGVIYNEMITPSGWRGAAMTVEFMMWDFVRNQQSTDSYTWNFILGKPAWDNGVVTVDSTSKMNMSRVKLPSVAIQNRCPWVFPATAAQRQQALNDPTSIYYQCGYSADQAGGCGNLNGGQVYTTCDYTKQNCQTNGMFSTDQFGNATYRFGGVTWVPPVQYNGKQYTSGQQVFGYNQPNAAVWGQYVNLVYGTQWVNCAVLAPAADPNSLRSECLVCVALWGASTIQMLLVNGVSIPYNNQSDALFTWRYINPGGRTGSISQDAIYNGQGDPHGSFTCIEFVVPVQLAAGGSIPIVQALVSGPPIATFVDNGNGTFQTIYQQSTNPVWHLLDCLTWGNWTWNASNLYDGDIDLSSFCVSAAVCDDQISYLNLAGQSATHERYRSSFALLGTQRQTLSSTVTQLRNSANLLLAPNSANGLLQCGVKRTLGLQQPAPVPGSNYNDAYVSEDEQNNPIWGYFAYLFQDQYSIIKGTFKTVPRPIADIPNEVAFQFQDEENQWQVDSITQIDPDAYVSSGNTPINVPLQVCAIPNFDQATRISNVALSEALRGNARDDADGTEYFQFQTSIKGIHLISMMGSICALTWQQLNINLQPIRILGAQPTLDGERITITAQWHNDDWYTDAYGQNPAPFYRNPFSQLPNRAPYPWKPGMPVWGGYGSSDALFPFSLGFDVSVDFTTSPPSLDIFGFMPVNTAPTGNRPLVPLQASTAPYYNSNLPSSWWIPAGHYYVALCVNGMPASDFIAVIINPGYAANSITISNIIWTQACDMTSLGIYIGSSSLDMHLMGAGSWYASASDPFGNYTTITLTAMYWDGIGLPDLVFNRFLLRGKLIPHGGVWGAACTSFGVDADGNMNVTFAGVQLGAQFNDYVLSAYAPLPQAGPLNWRVLRTIASSNPAIFDTLVLEGPNGPANISVALVMRAFGNINGPNYIGDANFINAFSPGGLTPGAEIGRQVRIISGTGAGQPPMTIVSNDSQKVYIAQNWYIQPDATSVFIIEESTWRWSATSSAMQNNYAGNESWVAGALPLLMFSTTGATQSTYSILIEVLTMDSNGNTSYEPYAQMREIFVAPVTLS